MQRNNEPADQSARRRFVEELDRNFSVVAAAGSGKTRAITDRIVQIAREQPGVLPQLVVVTFGNRAADEMQQRTRQLILEEKLPPEVVTAFNRAFFGTIHSFCMKLLSNHGHYLGLPAPLELITDDDELWQEFAQQQTRLGRTLSEENRAALFRLAQARDMMELGRRAGSPLQERKIGAFPKLDFSQVHAAPGKGSAKTNILNSKAELAEWEERFEGAWDFLRWPMCSTAAKDFVGCWREAFAPLRRWVNDAALCVAAEVQRDYRDYRLERGVVTYADQIALAAELLQHPGAAQRVRGEGFRVILDEAQDTDPAQFSVLLDVTRLSATTSPQPGHFCMVGDFQQSIYGERADLKNYRAVHDALVESGAAEALEFSVTFRLDQRQVEFINQTFSRVLNDQEGQVPFVELQPRPDATAGQVVRVSLGADLLPGGERRKELQRAKIAADHLARWIHTAGLEKLRADSWRDVAVLCPRKAWLRTLAGALQKIGLPIAIQSQSALKGDSPAHAWLAALCTIMVDPVNGYEIAGVLREIFGISDHDLAVFSEGARDRFRIDGSLGMAGIVSSRLQALAELRASLEGLALFDALIRMVERTQLRERLVSLPVEEFGELAGELDALLATAAEAEATGATLAELAAKLRAEFDTPRDVRLSPDDGIQLITSHKAKGSEWQAVIVPFLGRDIRSPTPRYPSLIKMPGSGEMLVALSKEDPSEEVRDAWKLAERQEMERLLYVATTRARHTLVLVFDRELFLDVKGNLSKRAQLKHLRGDAGEGNAEYFETLDTAAKACATTCAAPLRSEAGAEAAAPLEPVDRKTIQRATRRAAEFVRKFNPSGYDLEILAAAEDAGEVAAAPAFPSRSRADTPATLYGRWWHALFEQLPWDGDAERAEQIYARHQPRSPDASRSIAEWKLVREKLLRAPILAEFVAKKSARFQAEFPFAWSIKRHAVLEGQIDLLVIDEEAGKCLLLDWKTNKIAPGDGDKLRQHYKPQLAAYWRAVQEITRFEVQAGLYSTAAGQLLMYDSTDLASEWTRLANLPAEKLQGAVTPGILIEKQTGDAE